MVSNTEAMDIPEHFSEWYKGELLHGPYKNWINRMTPERFEQYKAHKKQYAQDNKERINERYRARYQENKERLCEKHVCETCGGRFTTNKKSQHCKTKKHQNSLNALN